MTEEHIAGHDFSVTEDEVGTRIDRYLTNKLGDYSRSRLKSLVKQGQVTIDGEVMDDPSRRVKLGQTIAIVMPEPEDPVPKPENIPLDVLFEDDHLIVINKPSGLVVHPAAGNWSGTLVNALIAHCGDSLSGIGGVKRPGIVHRLDKETSGVMVVAKSDIAHRELSQQFASHGKDGRMKRAYLALVWGKPPHVKGSVSATIGRATGNRTKMAVVERGGKHAVTHYERLELFANPTGEAGKAGKAGEKGVVSLVRCVLETGRTHQIRVHMAHIGCPLLGDTAYGAGFKSSARLLGDKARAVLEKFRGQALHAEMLGFEHPETKNKEKYLSPLPDELSELIQCLRDKL